MAPRGKAVPEIRWWLQLARGLIVNDDRDGGLIALGKELAKVQGRKVPWSHSVLSNFAHGKAPATVELAEAIAVYFKLPSPIFFARSLEETLEMVRVKEKYDGIEKDRASIVGSEVSPIARKHDPVDEELLAALRGQPAKKKARR